MKTSLDYHKKAINEALITFNFFKKYERKEISFSLFIQLALKVDTIHQGQSKKFYEEFLRDNENNFSNGSNSMFVALYDDYLESEDVQNLDEETYREVESYHKLLKTQITQ